MAGGPEATEGDTRGGEGERCRAPAVASNARVRGAAGLPRGTGAGKAARPRRAGVARSGHMPSEPILINPRNLFFLKIEWPLSVFPGNCYQQNFMST